MNVRNRRLPRPALRLPHFPKRQLRTLTIVLSSLLLLLMAFALNVILARARIYSIDWYDLTFALICIVPAAGAHLYARRHATRSAWWWLLWLPGIVLYWLRPWYDGTGIDLLWMRPSYIWNNGAALFWASWFNQPLPPRAFAAVVGFTVIATATAAALIRPLFELKAARRLADHPEQAGAGTVEGLPQARWADAREVDQSFNHPGGIVLGELTDPLEGSPDFDGYNRRSWGRQGKGKLITMDPARGNGHVVVIAASAGGKTAGIVIPNILNYKGPIVVLDPKGDLYARTREAREAMGYTARVIDAEHGFDPFKLIAPLAPTTPSIYLTMAKTLMPLAHSGSDISEYFHDMSCALFSALMAYYIQDGVQNVAAEISKTLNRSREDVVKAAAAIANAVDLSLIKQEMAGLAGLDERTFPGVVKSITNKLAFARFPDIACYGNSDDSPAEHMAALDAKTDIFINLPTLAAKDFSSFPRLLIGAMYVAAELLEQPDRPQARRLFIMDEARVLGGMDALTNVRDAGRSIGMHLMLIYQSLGQLKQAWGGEAGADAWLDSCEARVVGAVGAAKTAQDLVTMLGRRTIQTHTRGKSSSGPAMSLTGGSVGTSASEQLREVPLMSAAALGRLPAHGSLIFTRRTRPILATKALYFTRKEMERRVKRPEEVTDQLAATKRRRSVIEGLRQQAQQEAAAEQRASADQSSRMQAAVEQDHRENKTTAIEEIPSDSKEAAPEKTEAAVAAPADKETTVVAPQQESDDPVTPQVTNALQENRNRRKKTNTKSEARTKVPVPSDSPYVVTPDRRTAQALLSQMPMRTLVRYMNDNLLEELLAAEYHTDDELLAAYLAEHREQIGNTFDEAVAEILAAGCDTVTDPQQSDAEIAEPPPEREEQETPAAAQSAANTSSDNPIAAAGINDELTAAEMGKKRKAPRPRRSEKRWYLDVDRLRAELFQRHQELFMAAFDEPYKMQNPQDYRAGKGNGGSMKATSAEECVWHDHKSGIGGNLFDLFAIVHCGRRWQNHAAKQNFHEVLQEVCKWLGLNPQDYQHDPNSVSPQKSAAAKAARAEQDAAKAQDYENLIDWLQDRVKPIEGTPAETYLRARAITSWPAASVYWVGPLANKLPEQLQQYIARAKFGALLVFSRNRTNKIIGGQRVCLTRSGKKPSLSNPKCNFGPSTGAAIHFPAVTPDKTAPLIVTEGPETGLAVWHATNADVWAVLGVGGFKTLTLPKDRAVILAPDNDAENSRADHAFRAAVATHLQAGVDLQIARAPEGIKQDLADTLERGGTEAVRDAIALAAAPSPRDLPV
ncbi:MAG: type IV secretory system conjugative DNA transfer family protein [Aestuariivita sp.]|nr:type IV secretory system conjugative DNA transfer family protein [Aestuariivita sp.]MCY4345382.1 type IV secretory system conjugative DNA transfer family protein [Aestuariivita sp.]